MQLLHHFPLHKKAISLQRELRSQTAGPASQAQTWSLAIPTEKRDLTGATTTAGKGAV